MIGLIASCICFPLNWIDFGFRQAVSAFSHEARYHWLPVKHSCHAKR